MFGLTRWIVGPWGGGYGWRRWEREDSYAILRERYARGEITKEELDRLTQDLNEHASKADAERGTRARSGP